MLFILNNQVLTWINMNMGRLGSKSKNMKNQKKRVLIHKIRLEDMKEVVITDLKIRVVLGIQSET